LVFEDSIQHVDEYVSSANCGSHKYIVRSLALVFERWYLYIFTTLCVIARADFFEDNIELIRSTWVDRDDKS
jgi:hypothetical protein